MKYDTWGNLIDGSPLVSIFPDGRVPLISVWPIVPRERGAPRCYLVDVSLLSDEQIRALAELLYETWRHECSSADEAIAYMHDEGLPLRISHFSTVATTRLGLLNLP